MNPYVATQVQAIIETVRLLESLVTAPLGLYSDIMMMRESLPFPEAARLPRDEIQKRRIAYSALTKDPQRLALDAISSLLTSIGILEGMRGEDDTPLSTEWVSRARMVLNRAQQRVAGELRAAKVSRIRGLYVIVDPEATNGRHVLEIADAALRGGAKVIQLRDKSQDKGTVLSIARQLKTLCDERDALFVMNDDADVAVSSGADGLHVGQTDLPVPDARRILDPRQLIGSSNGTVEEAIDSQSQGADYIAMRADRSTQAMTTTGRTATGTETITKVKDLVSQPVVAIGGINAGNIRDVVRAGADCVCVVSAVTLAEDPERATGELVAAMSGSR